MRGKRIRFTLGSETYYSRVLGLFTPYLGGSNVLKGRIKDIGFVLSPPVGRRGGWGFKADLDVGHFHRNQEV